MTELLHNLGAEVYAIRWPLTVVVCFLIFMVGSARFLERDRSRELGRLRQENARLAGLVASYATHHSTCRMRAVRSAPDLLDLPDPARSNR